MKVPLPALLLLAILLNGESHDKLLFFKGEFDSMGGIPGSCLAPGRGVVSPPFEAGFLNISMSRFAKVSAPVAQLDRASDYGSGG